MIGLVAADGIISRFLVEHGLAREGNPLLVSWITRDAFMLIKPAGALVAALILYDIHRRHPRLSLVVTLCSVTFYAGLVWWSLLIFFANQV